MFYFGEFFLYFVAKFRCVDMLNRSIIYNYYLNFYITTPIRSEVLQLVCRVGLSP